MLFDFASRFLKFWVFAKMSKENPPKTGTVIDKTKTADGVAYPSRLRLALVLLSVFIGMFLVSLVCRMFPLNGTSLTGRIASSLQLRFLESPMNSIQLTTSVGTVRHTC